MRSVMAMAMKDLLLISRDGLGVFFIIGFPVLLGVLFGFMYNGFGDAGSANLRIAVVDEDQSDFSAKFLESLAESGGVELVPLARDEAIDQVRRGRLVGVVVLPAGYGEKAGLMWEEQPPIGLGVDPARKAEAGMLEGLVMQAAGTLMMDRFADPASLRPMIQDLRDQVAAGGPDGDEIDPVLRPTLSLMLTALDGFMGTLTDLRDAESRVADASGDADSPTPGFQLAQIESIDVTYDPEQGSVDDLTRRLRSPWDITFPQGMLWGVLACAATFAISIVRERKQGTLLRLEAAPVSRWQVLAGKAVACALAVLLVIVLLTGLGVALGMRPRSPGLLVVATLSVAFCFVGVMVLMSVVGKTEEAVSGAAWAGNMVMAMFGGGMIPLAFMPGFMETLSNASPVKWSILALEGAIWRGFSPGEMLLPCGVLVAIGAVAMAVGAGHYSRQRV